ncbi:MAG TPA: hypothetical protein VKB96_16300, partial [Gammaproteobacteria bacterium]|nr:hypothetical protein [Gammaproteobacteria bacterium]
AVSTLMSPSPKLLAMLGTTMVKRAKARANLRNNIAFPILSIVIVDLNPAATSTEIVQRLI